MSWISIVYVAHVYFGKSLHNFVWFFTNFSYPIMPGVPSRAALAPGNTRHPPAFRCAAATAAEMAELQTDCFHIRSEFLTKSGESADPPAQPPVWKHTRGSLKKIRDKLGERGVNQFNTECPLIPETIDHGKSDKLGSGPNWKKITCFKRIENFSIWFQNDLAFLGRIGIPSLSEFSEIYAETHCMRRFENRRQSYKRNFILQLAKFV